MLDQIGGKEHQHISLFGKTIKCRYQRLIGNVQAISHWNLLRTRKPADRQADYQHCTGYICDYRLSPSSPAFPFANINAQGSPKHRLTIDTTPTIEKTSIGKEKVF
jgi:hypothetical protein